MTNSNSHHADMSRPVSRRSALALGGGLAAFAGLAAACGGAPATGGGTTTTQQAGLTSEGGASGSIRILDDNTNKLYTNGVIAQFEKDTGIKVEKYEQANFNDLHDRLATLFSAQDSSYDVVMTWAAWSAEFGHAGWLQPLDKSVVPTDVLPAALDAVSYGGTIYGLPKFASAQTMFWNKQLFRQAGLDPEKPPATWDEFAGYAKTLTTGGRYGYACDMGNTDGAYQNFLRVLLLNGGTMYDAGNNPVFNSEVGIDALTRLVSLLRTDKVMNPSSLQITNSSDLNTLFANGQVGIVFNWPAQYAAATAAGALAKADVGNAVLPGIKVKSASIDGSEGFAINSFSKNKQAALKWLQYVTGTGVQKRMAQEEGWFPVTSTLLKDPEVVASLPVVTTYGEESQYQIKRFGAPWYSDVVQQLSTDISKAMLGQVTPADALNDAAGRAKTIIANYK
jgi:multiple sugar transport system substrate-binding protein